MTVLPEMVSDVERLRRGEWAVVDIPEHRDVVDFVTRIHYAGGAPNTSVARHGIVRRDNPDKLRGVALWLPPTKPATPTAT